MLNPSVLVAALVAKLQAIPALVTMLGGNPASIYGYQDQFPDRTDSTLAIGKQPQNTLMVMWRGTSPGNFGRNEVWSHQVSVIVKAQDPAAVFAQIVNGVPTGAGQRLTRVEVHPACYPMDTPSIDRRSVFIGQEAVLDYFEISVSFKEKGDY